VLEELESGFVKTGETLLAASITFEPTEDQLRQTIRNLCACSASAAIFDNSASTARREFVKGICEQVGISYLGSGANCGTGVALNALTDLALARGLRWLLYFDQDSEFDDEYAPALRSTLRLAEANSRVAAVGSLIRTSELKASSTGARANRFDIVTYTIASGTLIRVSGARSAGGFDEDLFLDTVDHEFCLRLKALGWVMLRDNRRFLRHEVGSDSRRIWIGLRMTISRHPAWRRELMWRNSLIIFRRYYGRFPLAMLKHLMIRGVDTILCCVVYRDMSYLRSALRGIRTGLSLESGMLAAKYDAVLNRDSLSN
jgi:rhamnosyltransferase